MAIKIGPNFFNELAAAGLAGLPFSWGSDGAFEFGAGMTQAQIAAVHAVYAAHDPSKPDPNQQLAAAIGAGCQIVSTSTPTLNGTYALDDVARANITAEALYLQVTQGQGAAKFTNGQTMKDWPDLTGSGHSFTPAQFIPFAEAIANAYDALLAARDAAMAPGGSWVAPTQPVTIA